MRTNRLNTCLLSLCLLGMTVSCYDPPVREMVLLRIDEAGALHLSVETIFKQGTDLSAKDREAILHVLDMYDLGRDPWLRGFERAQAAEVSHECHGKESAPEKITREGVLPSVESLHQVMPDAIANFKLIEDEEDGSIKLRIVHIDIPESLRQSRRRMEKEIEAFSEAGFQFSDCHCDLYDYLEERPDRRYPVLQALLDEENLEGVLTPQESVLVKRLSEAFEELMLFSPGEGSQEDSPAISKMSFSPFEHDLCVQLPQQARETSWLILNSDRDERNLYCTERLDINGLTDEVWPDAEPRLLEDKLLEDPEQLSAAPFSCLRDEDVRAVEQKVWERILPRPYYELTWTKTADPELAATPTASE